MLFGLFVLLACQLAGEVLVRGLALPLPGPVVGIVLLVAGLYGADRMNRRSADSGSAVGDAADGLLRYLGLLFVPAGVGLAQSYDLVLAHWVAILSALLGSTAATLIVTVYTFRAVVRFTSRRTPS